MIDVGDPGESGQQLALFQRDRNERPRKTTGIKGQKIKQIRPTMERCDRGDRTLLQGQEVQEIKVEVNNIEFFAALAQLVEHVRIKWDWVVDPRIIAEG